MMNHYYRPCVQRRNVPLNVSRQASESVGDSEEDMVQEMKEIRANVLNIYHGSIYLAFKQYKQSVRMEMNEKMLVSHAHD
jgi:hypothetical protein